MDVEVETSWALLPDLPQIISGWGMEFLCGKSVWQRYWCYTAPSSKSYWHFHMTVFICSVHSAPRPCHTLASWISQAACCLTVQNLKGLADTLTWVLSYCSSEIQKLCFTVGHLGSGTPCGGHFLWSPGLPSTMHLCLLTWHQAFIPYRECIMVMNSFIVDV